MGNEELSNYIKQARKLGMTDEDIRRGLLASGWQEGDINEELGRESIYSGLLSVTQLLRKALAKLRERYGVAFRIILLPLMAGVLGFILFIYTPDSPALSLLAVLVATVLFVVSAIFNVVALISFVHLFGKEEILKPSEYIRIGFKKFWSYVWLAVLSSFIVLGGYFLLLVPGILFSIWFGMAIYVLILEDRKGMEALLRSRHLVLGKFWKTAGRVVFMAIVGVVILIPFWAIDFLAKVNLSVLTQIVSYAVVVPLSISFYSVFFQNLVQLKSEPFVYDKKSARKFIIAGLAGILIVFALVAFGGYYYFTKLKPLLQTPVVTPTYDLTADWLVYNNEQYGFKFKYPADYQYKEYNDGSISIVFAEKIFEDQIVNEFATITVPKSTIDDIKHAISNNNFVENKLIIEGNTFTILSWSKPDIYNEPRKWELGLIQKESLLYEIERSFYPAQIQKFNFDQILSTFKFIEPNQMVCIQVITPARNPQTGEVRDFPTPCDVPEGWSRLSP